MKNAAGGTLPTVRVGVGASRVTYSVQVGRLAQMLSDGPRTNLLNAYKAYQRAIGTVLQTARAAQLNALIMMYRRQLITKGVSGLSDIGLGAAEDIQPGNLADPALVAASDALASNLAANGCKQGFVQEVADFQQAWLSAGGTLPSDTGGRSPVDGFYGANTAAALQVIQPSAPGGCVGKASGGGGVTAVTPVAAQASAAGPTAIFASMMSSPGQHPWAWLLVGTGVVLLYQAAGKSYKRSSRRSSSSRRRRPSRGRKSSKRRRNPAIKFYTVEGTSPAGAQYYFDYPTLKLARASAKRLRKIGFSVRVKLLRRIRHRRTARPLSHVRKR